MSFCFFLIGTVPAGAMTEPPDDQALMQLHQLTGQTQGLRQFRLHTPTSAYDPMLNDGQGPALVIQALFDEIEALENAVSEGGGLHGLTDTDAVKALGGAEFTQQAMLQRVFPVPETRAALDSAEPHCTYLVGYEGPAQDTGAWLSHYLNGHPALMAQLPGIRKIEIYSRLDWCGGLPCPRADYMQRNQVVFDNPEALTMALASPLRARMREHFQALPPFKGAVTHFPMRTTVTSSAR